jgi:hypothetical protein
VTILAFTRPIDIPGALIQDTLGMSTAPCRIAYNRRARKS